MSTSERLLPIADRSVAPFRKTLLDWYHRHGRSLPWRGTTDAWRVWVSETMLQQTTVAAVLPHYERFLKTFPTMAGFAAAPTDEVLAAWSGLGYYARARNLHAAARSVMRDHAGRFPDDDFAVTNLPGVGDYTAAALLSILHGQARAVVDGNVIRVVARFIAAEGHSKSSALKKLVQQTVDRLIDPAHPGDFNQAMMELGATICTPTSPQCDLCPVQRWCRGAALGDPTRWPEAPPKAVPREERWLVALIRRDDKILFRKRSEAESVMPGLWELPSWKCDAEDGAPWLLKQLRRDVGETSAIGKPAGEARHSIMNRRLQLSIFHATVGPDCRAPRNWKWIPQDGLAKVGTSSMVKKVLAATAAVAVALALLVAPRIGSAQAEVTLVQTDSVAAAKSVEPIAPQIPDLAYRTVTGESGTLHDLLKQGPVLLDFWALWCKPCVKELPELEKLHQAWTEKGFHVLAVNSDAPSDLARVAPFVRSRKLSFPVITDADGSIRRRFQVNALPTTILLDQTGRSVLTSQGYRPGDEAQVAEKLQQEIEGGAE